MTLSPVDPPLGTGVTGPLVTCSLGKVRTKRYSSHGLIRGWMLPREGSELESCGDEDGTYWKCGGCGHTIVNKEHCDRAECPRCGKIWINRQKEQVWERLHLGFGLMGHPRHIAVNPAPELWGMPERKLRQYCIRQLEYRVCGDDSTWLGGRYKGKAVGLRGGWIIFHPFRWKKADGFPLAWRYNAENPEAESNIERDQVEYLKARRSKPPPEGPIQGSREYSPHYHVLAWGFLPYVLDLQKYKHLSYYNIRTCRTKEQTCNAVYYALSHCGIHEAKQVKQVEYTREFEKRDGTVVESGPIKGRSSGRVHAYAWFGVLSNGSISVSKWREKEERTCPICGEKMSLEGHGSNFFKMSREGCYMTTKRAYRFKDRVLVSLEVVSSDSSASCT